MKKSFACPVLIVGLLFGTVAKAEGMSAYGCSGLEMASALPSVEGVNGVFYRVLADLRLRHPMEDAAIAQIAALSDALATAGTTLVYVAVPTKSQAMPEFLPSSASDYGFDSATATLVYDDILARLSAQGVLSPDILTALVKSSPEEPPFFQADFHWTSNGARLAAVAIGDVIKAQSFYDEMPVSEYKTMATASTTAFSTMRRTLQAFCIDELPRVEAIDHQTDIVESADQDLSDIFADDDDAVQIVLVGTSFSDAPLSNFAGYLSEYSGLDVVNYAVTGGNQFGAITSYLTSRDFAENPPRFLIWENPIYNNLAQFGLDPMEELVAAAGKTCLDPLVVQRSGANSLTTDLSGLTLARTDVIRADLGQDGPREASFVLTTASGVTRTSVMQRSDRMLASGQFFKSLGSIWHSDLTSLTVTFDRPVSDRSSLTLCPLSRKDSL